MSKLKEELDEARGQTIAMEKAIHTYLTPAVEEATDSLEVLVKKFKDNADLIYVTVGHPAFGTSIQKLVPVLVLEPTKIQQAKMVRKEIADNIENHGYGKRTKFKPSELFYVVYVKKGVDMLYIASSENAPDHLCVDQ